MSQQNNFNNYGAPANGTSRNMNSRTGNFNAPMSSSANMSGARATSIGAASFRVVMDGPNNYLQEFQTCGNCLDEDTYRNFYVLDAKEFNHLKQNSYFFKLCLKSNYLTFAYYRLNNNNASYIATVFVTTNKFKDARQLYNNIINTTEPLNQRIGRLTSVARTSNLVSSKNIEIEVHSLDVNYIINSLQNILDEERFANDVYFANLKGIEENPDFILVNRNRYLHRIIEELQDKVSRLSNELRNYKSQNTPLQQDFNLRLNSAIRSEQERLQKVIGDLKRDYVAEVQKVAAEIKREVEKISRFQFQEPSLQELQQVLNRHLDSAAPADSYSYQAHTPTSTRTPNPAPAVNVNYDGANNDPHTNTRK